MHCIKETLTRKSWTAQRKTTFGLKYKTRIGCGMLEHWPKVEN
jgi:hypothetical protein